MSSRHSVFTRMWGVAVLALLAGNWRYGDIWARTSLIGVALLLTGLVAVAVTVRPRRSTLPALSVLVALTVVLEAPVLATTGFWPIRLVLCSAAETGSVSSRWHG